ncbi:hypothetical protein [Novosphingobium sp. Rr 2-17]|uniref:hypothetical protein n=1 Tax=Novosphingobium sp. Rr 2-17 TaxID=555793 RepID=UPI000694AC70|nr:hypothetical protein [Novosphingobium sp. Rr 2-17]
MEHASHCSPRALTAIAVIVALSAIPALAQETATAASSAQPTASATPPSRAATPRAAREAPAASVPTARSHLASQGNSAQSPLADGPVPAAPLTSNDVNPPAAPVQDNTLPTAGVVGLLAAFGIAGVGIARMRSHRRRDVDYGKPDTAYPPAPDDPATPALPEVAGNRATTVQNLTDA